MLGEKQTDISYAVKLKLEVSDNEENTEYFSKNITLPFPPYIGLQILLEDCESGNPTDPIKSVMWNEYSEMFVCCVEWRFPPDTYTDGHYWIIESHVACAESDGWEQE
ncbi:hypothetical protein MNBD_GAMMA10-1656 [hydrothermal vent metagenome]|uniref:Uncharacterized protein n=1 Tax=hydrothermal vent metagenome TaxID=652676 RepID=A0A3B0YQS6_9ZZZZ